MEEKGRGLCILALSRLRWPKCVSEVKNVLAMFETPFRLEARRLARRSWI